jgi:hypothetical protein
MRPTWHFVRPQAEVERYAGFIGMPASLAFRHPSS